jgi:vitamin B12 transporter
MQRLYTEFYRARRATRLRPPATKPCSAERAAPGRGPSPSSAAGAAAALVALACGLTASPAAAQTQLPGIVVVEGATLETRPARAPRPPAAPTRASAAPTPASTATPAPAAAETAGVLADVAGTSATTGTAAPAGTGGIPLDRVGTAVSVVTGEELRQRQVPSVADALRALPGVSVNHAGTFTGQTQVRIRGGEGNHTLVMIDGVEANTGSTGELDFSHLSTGDIERIEVLRGPQSGLYGSGAIGGVVNIVTRSGEGPARATITSEGGSYGMGRFGLTLSGGNEKASALMAFDRLQARGYNIAPIGSEDDEAKRQSFLFKGSVRPIETLAIDMMVRHVAKSGERDGDLTCPFPAPPDCKGLSRQVDTPSFFASRMLLAGLEVRLDQLDGALTHKLSANLNRTRLDDTDVSDFGAFFSRNDNERGRLGLASTWRLATPSARWLQHSLTGLVEFTHERFNPVTADDQWRSREHVAYAGEYRVTLADRLDLTGTLRHDGRTQVDDPLAKAADVEAFTTWRTTASWRIPELGLRPHASYGTGVKLPTMFELFGFVPAIFVANPNLEVETSRGWDVGLERSFLEGRIVLDATYFRQTLRDEIETYFEFDCSTAPCRFVSKVRNREGTSERQGVELTGRWRPSNRFSLGAAYTYLDAREPDGTREIRRAPHAGRVDASLGFGDGRGRLTVAAAYNGKADDIAFALPGFTATRVTLGDYWLVSAAASWRLAPGMELFGRVENLFDETYREVHGFATPGLAAYGGLKITFGGPDGVTVAGDR